MRAAASPAASAEGGAPTRGPIDPRLLRRAAATHRYLVAGVLIGVAVAFLTVAQARVLADTFGHVIVLQVEDSGPGVPQAERELIFQPFYRALGSEADGSGLGLPIVQEIARQHGARMAVEDAHPGQTPPGACFSVRFTALDEVTSH